MAAVSKSYGNIDSSQSVSVFVLTTFAPMPIQLDGELIKLKAQQKVKVISAPSKLRTYR